MENENKKTCEIIIKKDGETVVQEKTNAIFCIINKDDRVTNGVFIDNVSGKDLLCILKAYKKECLNKGRSNFAPVKKINRVLNSLSDDLQVSFFNNLRTARLTAGLKQEDVVKEMQRFDARFNVSILSRFENGICLPTPYQLAQLARIYDVQPHELVRMDDNALGLFAN